MIKKFLIPIAVILLLVGGAVFYLKMQKPNNALAPSTSQLTPAITPNLTPTIFPASAGANPDEDLDGDSKALDNTNIDQLDKELDLLELD